MKVIGPKDWPSTLLLQESLSEVESDKVLYYGTQGRKNGIEQLEAFRDAGLSVPTFTSDRAVVGALLYDGIDVWGRKLIHSHGADIVSVGMQKRFRSSDYWVVPVPSVREFRQHIFDGRAIRVGEKSQTSEPWRKLPIRSRSNGWTLQYSGQPPIPEGVRELARRGVESLGYLFGAADIILGEDNRLYLLEVNSAPSLRDAATLSAYVKGVKRWISNI